MRRPVAQRVAAVSREAGLLYTLNYPGLTLERRRQQHGRGAASEKDAETLQQIYARVRANWEWAWETTIDGDLQRALSMLQS